MTGNLHEETAALYWSMLYVRLNSPWIGVVFHLFEFFVAYFAALNISADEQMWISLRLRENTQFWKKQNDFDT